MNTVDFVLTVLVTLMVSNIGTAALAARNWHRAERAQRENARLVAQLRGAGYDTGIVEHVPASW